EPLGDRVGDLARDGVGRLAAGTQHGEHDDRFSLEPVRDADRGRLEHGGMRRGRRLDLRRTDALAGHLERVVAPAVDVPEPVCVDPGPVAVDPDAGKASPVRGEVLLWVAPEAPRHAGPRLADDKLADRAAYGAATVV